MRNKKIISLFLTTTLTMAPQLLEAISGSSWVGGFDSNNLLEDTNWDPIGAPGSNEIGIFDTTNNPPLLLEASSFTLKEADITVDGFQMSISGDCTLDDLINDVDTTSSIFVNIGGVLTMNGTITTDGVVNYYMDGGAFVFSGEGGGTTSSLFLQNGSTCTVNNPLEVTFLSSSALTDAIILTESLTLLDSGVQTLAGSFSGNGALAFEGSGFLTFTGTSTNTGSVSMTGGTFFMQGSMADISSLSISGGTLKGTGSVGPVTLAGSCIVAPGGSIGTLTVDSIEFNSSSTLLIELDPSVASLLNVVGTAALDGTVEVVQDAGLYERTKTYQIINAGNITGQFDNLIGGLSGYNFSLREDGDSLYLSYEAQLINTHSLTGNRRSVADYMNKYASNETFFLVNGLEGNDLKTAMDAISPARNAFGTYIVEQNAFSLSGLLASHIDGSRSFVKDQNPSIAALLVDANDEMIGNPSPSQGDFSAWGLGFGELAHQKSSQHNPAFHYAVGGALGGFDHKMGEGLAGFALGYSGTYFHDSNHMGRGHINSYFASIYGNAPIGSFYFSPAIWGVFNETHNIRDIVFPGVSEEAKAHIFSWQVIPHLETGYRFKLPFGVITPYTSADLAILWQRGYQEHGASPFNATQKRNNSSMVRSETGLKFFENWEKDWGSFVMKEQVAYVFEKPYGIGTVNTSLVGTPSSFTVTAVNQNLNLALVGMDFICSIGKKNPVQLSLSAKGEFGVNYQLGELTLDVVKRF